MEPSSHSTSGRIAGALVIVGVLIAGCGRSGPQRHEVSGSVTFAGEETPQGSISFVPIGDTKGPQVGGNIEQGHYHIDRKGGPVAGRHRVEITLLRKTGRKVSNMGGQPIDQMRNVVPAKYSGATSELAVTIEPQGENVFDFDLKAN
jgi:hypothetical protein